MRDPTEMEMVFANNAIFRTILSLEIDRNTGGRAKIHLRGNKFQSALIADVLVDTSKLGYARTSKCQFAVAAAPFKKSFRNESAKYTLVCTCSPGQCLAPPEVALSLIPIYGHGLHGAWNRIRRGSHAGAREQPPRKREITHRRDAVRAFGFARPV